MYEIKGVFGHFTGSVPPNGLRGMEAWQIAKEFNTSMEYAENLKAVIDRGGFSIPEKPDAHNRFGLHQ